MPSVTTNVTELPESRVRVSAEVSAEEVERRPQQAAKRLGSEMRVPGFRKGKVPPAVVIRRLGREAVLDEAVRSSLGNWYVDAIDEAGISPIGEPELDMSDLPDQGKPLEFSIEIGVRPKATLGQYKGVEVGRRDPKVEESAIDEQVEELRNRVATLETVERPAAAGDQVVVDYVGTLEGVPFEGGEGRDQLIELGSGNLIPGFEDQLLGASAGDVKTVEVTFPDDYPSEELAGQAAAFEVTVHEVKAKRLPELDDDLAGEASEFDARAHKMIGQTLSALERQGISKETYLQLSGKSEHELADEAEPEAAAALRREAVLAAVVAGEAIEATEEQPGAA